ncbi:MAG: L-threonylcarbamoyladenylate synthase [Ignavibacteriae bacterium]|nr:L-threonylcarbamoyladenylate synthase [Ignavibacteriota bacterium]
MTEITKKVDIAVSEILKGNVVALPTETVYGLGANGLNKNAVLKIYEVKKRPHFNPLILHIYSIDELKKYAKHIPDEVYKLAECFSPGPITFVLEKKSNIPDIITAGLDSVAIRFPSHKMFRRVLKESCVPIAAPSANMFGRISPVTARDVYKELKGKINYILDGDKCEVGIESTVISFLNDRIRILRPGFVTSKDIEMVIGRSLFENRKWNKENCKSKYSFIKGNKYLSPGMLKNHYAPNTPLYIVKDLNLLTKISKQDFYHIDLSKYKNLKSIASNLFKEFRKADEKKYDFITIQKVENTGLGIAINDRIEKASSGNIETISGKSNSYLI